MAILYFYFINKKCKYEKYDCLYEYLTNGVIGTVK